MANKFDAVSGTRSRLQSLLEKYTESDPRSDKDEDGFVVPPPMSPYHSFAKPDHRLSQVLSQCRAWNYDDFRHRLQTFSSPVNWFGKPDFLSPIECALHGWCNVDVNTIHCFHCKESVKHSSDSLQMDLELPRSLLTDSHALHCGWRKSCCRRFFANVPNFDFPDKAFIDTSLDFLDLLAATAKIDFQTNESRLVEEPTLHTIEEPVREGGEVVADVLSEEVLRSAESELQGERKEVEAVVRDIVDSVGATSEPSDPITTSEESAAKANLHLDNTSTAVATAVAGERTAVDLTPFISSNDCDLPFLHHLLPSPATQSSHLSLQEQPLSFLLSRLAAVSSLPQREVVTVHLIDLLVKFFEAFPATDAIDLPRLLFLAVVCGWKHSSGRSEATSPSAIPATSSITSSSDAGRLVLHCSLCCQRFDVLDLCMQGKKLNLLTQHRYYCPFVSRQFFYDDITDITGKDKRDDEKVVVGWECRLQAINHFFEGKIGTSLTPASGKRKRVFADISEGGGVEKKDEEQLPPPAASVHLSPENVYKKIRSVLYDALN